MKYYSYFKDWAVVQSVGELQELARYKRNCGALLSGQLPPVLASLCCVLCRGGHWEGVESEGLPLTWPRFTRRPVSFITTAHTIQAWNMD